MKITFAHLVYVSLGLILLAGGLVQFNVDTSLALLPLAAVLGIWVGYLTR